MADNQNELLTHIWEELKQLRTDFRDAAKDRQLWESKIALKVNSLEVDHQNRVRWSTAIVGVLFACGMAVAGWVTNIQMTVHDLQQESQKKP